MEMDHYNTTSRPLSLSFGTTLFDKIISLCRYIVYLIKRKYITVLDKNNCLFMYSDNYYVVLAWASCKFKPWWNRAFSYLFSPPKTFNGLVLKLGMLCEFWTLISRLWWPVTTEKSHYFSSLWKNLSGSIHQCVEFWIIIRRLISLIERD